MALNLTDQIAVIRSATMQARCSSAVAKYATYLLGGTPTDPQLAWAREAIRTPATVGEQVSWYLLSEPNFLTDGSGITDGQLQGAVEAAINNYFIAGE